MYFSPAGRSALLRSPEIKSPSKPFKKRQPYHAPLKHGLTLMNVPAKHLVRIPNAAARQMQLANAFCRFAELAAEVTASF
jgi:hypothetical protein